MTKHQKDIIGFIILGISYLPVLLRFTYHYQPFEKTFVKIAADAAFISFTWLIISGFRQGYFRLVFSPNALSTFHNHMGVWSMALLIFHPVGNAVLRDNWWIFIPFAHGNTTLLSLGAVAFILLILIIISSLTLRKINYDLWNASHYLTYVFYLLVFIHSFITLDVTSPTAIYYYVLFSLASIATITKLLFDLEVLSFRSKMISVTEVADTTFNIVFTVPKNLHAIWQPGQYVMIGLKRFGDNHPFSISRINDNGTVEVTFKVFGTFTDALSKLTAADKIFVAGAYGNIHHDVENTKKDLVFVAGGIGITPFRAIIHDQLINSLGRDIYLFYCVKSPAYLAFDEEFVELTKLYPNFHYKQVCELDPPPGADKGYISIATIKKAVGELDSAYYFACGPGPMMKIIKGMLKKAGVRSTEISLEEFSY